MKLVDLGASKKLDQYNSTSVWYSLNVISTFSITESFLLFFLSSYREVPCK